MKNIWIIRSISMLLFVTTNSLLIAEKSLADNLAVGNISQINYTSPLITRSVASNDRLLIQVSASQLPLNRLNIALDKQNIDFDKIKLTDQFGQEIKADKKISKDQIMINFTEPVEPGKSLQIKFQGVNTQAVMGRILLYRLSIESEQLGQPIPIGVARIYVPDAS
ncbi:MAG: DUF2808 domain-containing protein [Calothrix sp. MO_167.B42]|nr:DUF2808 domain-containing protein [Calothrix sp. MO_167.B42]